MTHADDDFDALLGDAQERNAGLLKRLAHADDANPPTGQLAAAFLHATNAVRAFGKAALRTDLVLALHAGDVGYDPFVGYYRRTDNGSYELSSEQRRLLGEMADRGEIVVHDGTVTLASRPPVSE